MNHSILVTGPQYCRYEDWILVGRGAYSQRKYFEWLWSGLLNMILVRDQQYRVETPVELLPLPKKGILPKRVSGAVSLLTYSAFPLAPTLQLFCDTFAPIPYLPPIKLHYEEGDISNIADLTGIYMDPVNHPDEGKLVPAGIWANIPLVYWPQRNKLTEEERVSIES